MIPAVSSISVWEEADARLGLVDVSLKIAAFRDAASRAPCSEYRSGVMDALNAVAALLDEALEERK